MTVRWVINPQCYVRDFVASFPGLTARPLGGLQEPCGAPLAERDGQPELFILQRVSTRSCCSIAVPVAAQLGVTPPGHEPQAEPAERIAYGVLVAALEEGLVSILQHAMDVLKRLSAPVGPLGEQRLSEQEKKLR